MERKKLLQKTIDIIETYYKHSEKHPVLEHLSPREVRKKVDLTVRKKGMNERALFSELEKIVLLSPRTSSKGFFNLLFGGKILPAVAAEMMTAALNNTLHTYKAAGVHILIEQEVIGFFLKKIGYSYGDGTFVPGGSLANMTAMIVARNEKNSKALTEGMHNTARMIVYTSDQGHYSIPKAAGMIGVGLENVRTIQSDAQGKMDTIALEKAIIADKKKGYLPFFIKATAGTTVLGAFDPIKEISRIAKKHNIWLHVDASFGGTIMLSKKHKHLLEGIDQADSVTRNPHKMMNVPILAAVIAVKEKGVLERSFYESADYLFQMDGDEYNPGTKTIQCGRRNDALKVWTALKYLGESGYEKRITQQFSNAQHAVKIIKKDPSFSLVVEPESINVCFEVVGADAKILCEKLDTDGAIKVSYGTRNKKTFVRMVCVDADMTHKDIEHFFKQIKKHSN